MSPTISAGHSHISTLYGKQLARLISDPLSDGSWALVFQGDIDGIHSITRCMNADKAVGKTLLRYALHPDSSGLDLHFSDDITVVVEANPNWLTIVNGYQLV